jgi:anaerobic ribonucleoside-triphosphate reductase activating protein
MGVLAMRIHHFLSRSRANGPGCRAVVWVQGCSLHCPGCYNSATHLVDGGHKVTVGSLVRRIVALGDSIEGVTVSGGEPLDQSAALVALLMGLRIAPHLSVLLFTGYTWEEVCARPEGEAILSHVDVLLAGRYEAAQRLARSLCGSSNKTVHFLTERYGPADLSHLPAAEAVVSPEGVVVLTGIDPPRWLTIAVAERGAKQGCEAMVLTERVDHANGANQSKPKSE